jgi:protein gp37
MRRAHWHQFQVLTKRAERLAEVSADLPWPKNVWMGVSVESRKYLPRVEDLRRTGASTKFLSLEPLLEDLGRFDLNGIDWVIVGGESGPGARRLEENWAIGLRDLCAESGVPFFFKQWGGVNKKATGRLLDGRTYDEMPTQPLIQIAGVA